MKFKNPYSKKSVNYLLENPDEVFNLTNFAFSCNKDPDNNFITITIIAPNSNTHISKNDTVMGFIGIDEQTLRVRGSGSVNHAFEQLGYKIVPTLSFRFKSFFENMINSFMNYMRSWRSV